MRYLYNVSVLLLLLCSQIAAADVVTKQMSCKKLYGNPIFTELQLDFAAEEEGKSSRPVNITVNYTHSGLDTNYYDKPFTKKSTVYNIMNGDYYIDFDDDGYDYSGGRIDFSYRDDSSPALAVISYGSDGRDLFGVLECSTLPSFTW